MHDNVMMKPTVTAAVIVVVVIILKHVSHVAQSDLEISVILPQPPK